MSHVDSFGKIADTPQAVACLTAAAKSLGGVLTKSDTYNWYGTHVGDHPLPEGFAKEDMGKCIYKITFPGVHYEVGIARHPKRPGELVVIFDHYADGKKIQALIGKQAEKLLHAYGVNAAMLWARSRGLSPVVKKNADGSTLVEVAHR
jgi:hypothetical protein